MKITRDTTDTAVLAELGARMSQARLRRNLSQQELAYEAGLSKRTLERMESGKSTQLSSLVRVLRALSVLERLEALLPEELPSPIAELKQQGKRKERASKKRSTTASAGVWQWGAEHEDDNP